MKPVIPTHRPRALQAHQSPKTKRPSAAARGYGADWRKLRESTPRTSCVDCGAIWQRSFHLDHVQPKSQGGTDDVSNLRWRCLRCHSRKTARQDGGFGRAPKARGTVATTRQSGVAD